MYPKRPYEYSWVFPDLENSNFNKFYVLLIPSAYHTPCYNEIRKLFITVRVCGANIWIEIAFLKYEYIERLPIFKWEKYSNRKTTCAKVLYKVTWVVQTYCTNMDEFDSYYNVLNCFNSFYIGYEKFVFRQSLVYWNVSDVCKRSHCSGSLVDYYLYIVWGSWVRFPPETLVCDTTPSKWSKLLSSYIIRI